MVWQRSICRVEGEIKPDNLRKFVSLDVRRIGQELHLEQLEVIASMPTRGGKRKINNTSNVKRKRNEPNRYN